MINYPCNYEFTRIGEYKYFLWSQSKATTVSYEYPQLFVLWKNERYYPLFTDSARAAYLKYASEASNVGNLILFGRLGDYKYYDMDTAIAGVISKTINL